jgi:hypothetical protein
MVSEKMYRACSDTKPTRLNGTDHALDSISVQASDIEPRAILEPQLSWCCAFSCSLVANAALYVPLTRIEAVHRSQIIEGDTSAEADRATTVGPLSSNIIV